MAIAALALGLVAAAPAAVHASVALLGLELLARDGDRLLLAPLYGACLLVAEELAQRSLDLRAVARIGPGVIITGVGTSALVAAAGGCAATLAAAGVTVAPSRSPAFTGLAVAALLVALAAVAHLARRLTRPQTEPRGSPTPGQTRVEVDER